MLNVCVTQLKKITATASTQENTQSERSRSTETSNLPSDVTRALSLDLDIIVRLRRVRTEDKRFQHLMNTHTQIFHFPKVTPSSTAVCVRVWQREKGGGAAQKIYYASARCAEGHC